MDKVKLLTKYRNFFKEGEIVEVSSPAESGQMDHSKAKQLVKLGRAIWVEKDDKKSNVTDDSRYPEGEPSMDWLKDELQAYAEDRELAIYGTKSDILERIEGSK